MPEQEIELQALGMMDVFKLADKDLIDKILSISKLIKIEKLDNGNIKFSLEIVPVQKD